MVSWKRRCKLYQSFDGCPLPEYAMRLWRSDLQFLQSLRPEMRSGNSRLRLRRPGLQLLQSLRSEMRPGELRIPSFRRSVC